MLIIEYDNWQLLNISSCKATQYHMLYPLFSLKIFSAHLPIPESPFIYTMQCVWALRVPQKLWFEEGEKKQWTKEKGPTNDLQSTTQQSKDRATRTPHRARDERMCSRKISSFCPTSGTHRVTLVQHDWENGGINIMTKGIYQWLFVTMIFHNS